jgi:hypothetical protein
MDRGQEFTVVDALGVEHRKRAIASVEANGADPRLLACDPEEWTAAQQEGRDPEPDPFAWPMSSVKTS